MMKLIFAELTIVTSCTGYGQYLSDWANSICEQTMLPGRVVIFTHGVPAEAILGRTIAARLMSRGIRAEAFHENERLDFGTARNRAVAYTNSDWVMHFDCDDTLYPYAVEEFYRLAPDADVIPAGYTLAGNVSKDVARRHRVYHDSDGLGALTLHSIASGVSPFRRSFWEQTPYPTDMFGAWDTALWIGFARLGARFRATKRGVFQYRQHHDSIFSTRRRTNGWARAKTSAQLKALRRAYTGVAVLIPRDAKRSTDREPVFQRIRAHYRQHHPAWECVVGSCPVGPWVKGLAIHDALTKTSADVLIIADADCIVDPDALRVSVSLVQSGAPWSMPHLMVHRANRQNTERICAQSADVLPGTLDADAYERNPYEGALGGGIVVIRRVWYEAMGGMPLAFRGWGSEDRALGVMADALIGPCVRGTADLLHLYHTPQVTSNHNLQVLRSIGAAALEGQDALIARLSQLGNTAFPPKVSTRRHASPAVMRLVPLVKTEGGEKIRRRRIP